MTHHLLRYTGYKKFHAYKLLVVCSMFTKCVLAIFIRPATVADALCWTLDTSVATLLGAGMYLLGDAAFSGMDDIVAPFSTTDINLMHRTKPEAAAEMRTFNQVPSS
jgi:hypothetical protein